MRYFFDLLDGKEPLRDEEGAELADDAAARQEAIVQARAIMAEEIRGGELDLSMRFDVRTEKGPAFTLPFDQALRITHARHDVRDR